jgi:transcriptional regulator with XRE-family HTH domain
MKATRQALPTATARFGSSLRALRLAAGYSQRELAEAVGIDFTYLSKLENGRGQAPADSTIKRLASELRADPARLAALAGKVPPAINELANRDLRFASLINALPSLTAKQLSQVYAAAAIDEVALPTNEALVARRRPRRQSRAS